MTKVSRGVGPSNPQVVVLVGATGDLAKRKLLPGLFHLVERGLHSRLPDHRRVARELGFGRHFASKRARRWPNSPRAPVNDADWDAFCANLELRAADGGAGRAEGGGRGRRSVRIGQESRRLHYLSVPPSAALVGGAPARRGRSRRSLARHHGKALRHRSRRARCCSMPSCTRCSARIRFSASIIFSARSRRRTFWRSVSPTAYSSRSGIATSSITCKSTSRKPWGSASAPAFYEADRRLPRHGGHAPVPDPRLHGHGAADVARARAHQRREEQSVSQHAADQAERRGARPVHRLPHGRGGRRGLGYRDLHRAEMPHRQLALGGRAVFPAHRQAARRRAANHFDRVSRAARRACFPPARASASRGPIT